MPSQRSCARGADAYPANASRREPAVDRQAGACYETGFGAGEVRDHPGDLVRGAVARQRHELLQHLGELADGGLRSVSTGPGCTLLTVIPRGPRSRASPFASPCNAALLIAYVAPPTNGIRSALQLPMLMTRPPLFMCLMTAWVATNTARTLIAKVRSKSSRLKRSIGAIAAIPALFTKMS